MMEVKKKGLISEEDVSLILRRYTATTILALLQEVAQFPGVKIDWNALVKKTSTGISSAREYQMLWRHLAYRHSLVEKLEEGAEPLDDDSDLEFEVETFPAVSNEATTEAAACVKVLIASGMPGDSVAPNSTLEAPLTINIPNTSQALGNQSGSKHSTRPIQGMNITVPVSVQKQPLPAASCGELLEGNGPTATGQAARRKRKLWTEDEDKELIAAVQKCGEGNWANILKGDFKHDRTASQLSQRWAIIRKRQANSNLTAVDNPTSSGLSDAQLATRQAVSMALNMSMSNSISSVSSFGTPLNSSSQPATPASVAPVSAQPLEPGVKLEATPQALQSPQAGVPRSAPSQTAKVKSVSKKSSAQPKSSNAPTPNPLVQAAAVAAGARIGTASDAASLYSAGQCRNTLHGRPAGVPLAKPIPPGPKASCLSAAASRPSNVHYIRTGLSPTSPVYSGSLTTSVQRSAGGSGRAAPVSPRATLATPSTLTTPPNQTISEMPKSSSIPSNSSSGTSGGEFMSQDAGDRNAAGGKSESSSEELRISPLEQPCLPTPESIENQPVSEDSNEGKTTDEKAVADIVNHEVENGEKQFQNADS
ncbi:unnamed protein product [Victoria cruziana]